MFFMWTFVLRLPGCHSTQRVLCGASLVLSFMLGGLPPRAWAQAANASAPATTVHRVGPTLTLRTISAAAAVAKNGDTVEIEPGDYVGDVAVWTQDALTIRGVASKSGAKPKLVAAGASAEGKAIWVIRGGRISVENIIFTGARVRDKNGAGIRFEKGDLTVRHCVFTDNENGILTGGGDGTLRIESSEFGHNGAGDGQSHNLYVGALKKLTVSGSYFHHARVGHLLKSRAAENHITYNRLTDETGGTASYELEFPNGGLAWVVGNIIQQSATTENPHLISYGVEGYTWPINQLYLTHNTLVDDRPSNGVFLRVSPMPPSASASGGTAAAGPVAPFVYTANNLLVGKDSASLNAGTNNVLTDWSALAQASRQDYRLSAKSLKQSKIALVDTVNAAGSVALVPDREYVHPASSKKLAKPPSLPGALQTRGP
jgi:hypothetical protein